MKRTIPPEIVRSKQQKKPTIPFTRLIITIKN